MGEELAEETEKEQPVWVEGNPGEWGTLEAKWHRDFDFSSHVHKGKKISIP